MRRSSISFFRPGSSPHTRGALGYPDLLLPQVGIIPAYAGSTIRCRTSPARWWDHPRIRGEHVISTVVGWVAQGSSPHTRGALDAVCRQLRGRGIIPAYAGSTSRCRARPCPSRDHPRIRGEHALGVDDADLLGSSPHTRGARVHPAGLFQRQGIISAYAGSTSGRLPESPATRDHPRIRGEHNTFGLSKHRVMGSSPHTRGALPFGSATEKWGGIIPAYAGSTHFRTIGERSDGDHPRIRGEH